MVEATSIRGTYRPTSWTADWPTDLEVRTQIGVSGNLLKQSTEPLLVYYSFRSPGVNIFRKIGNFSQMFISKAINSSQKMSIKLDHILFTIYKTLIVWLGKIPCQAFKNLPMPNRESSLSRKSFLKQKCWINWNFLIIWGNVSQNQIIVFRKYFQCRDFSELDRVYK